MCEPQFPTRERDADLASVHVASKHEIEGRGRCALDHRRVVTQQDAKRLPTRQLGDIDLSSQIAQSVDSSYANRDAGVGQNNGVVAQQAHARHGLSRAGAAEGIARECHVVVPQHREDLSLRVDTGEEGLESRATPARREQITRDNREVEVAVFGPGSGPTGTDPRKGWRAQVKVGDVEDAKAVERRWQPFYPDLTRAEANPL